MYTPQIWRHTQQPKNRGQLASPTGQGSSSFDRCGDRLQLQVTVVDGLIQDIAWDARACGPVVAMASLATETIRGWPIDKALALSVLELDGWLGGLSPAKRHAIWLFLDCLHQALKPEDTLAQPKSEQEPQGDSMNHSPSSNPDHQPEPDLEIVPVASMDELRMRPPDADASSAELSRKTQFQRKPVLLPLAPSASMK